MESATRLGVMQSRIIEAASAAALETAVNTFLSGFGSPAVKQERLVSIQYMAYDTTHYSCCIIYSQ